MMFELSHLKGLNMEPIWQRQGQLVKDFQKN